MFFKIDRYTTETRGSFSSDWRQCRSSYLNELYVSKSSYEFRHLDGWHAPYLL